MNKDRYKRRHNAGPGLQFGDRNIILLVSVDNYTTTTGFIKLFDQSSFVFLFLPQHRQHSLHVKTKMATEASIIDRTKRTISR